MTEDSPATEPIFFSEEDFAVEGSGKLDSIMITTLSDAAVDCLTLGAQGTQVNDVIAIEVADRPRFAPLVAPTGLETQFQFTPVFSNGWSGDTATVELYLPTETNGVPVAESLELTIYRSVAVATQFFAVGPEGDLLTYHILSKPAHGAVTTSEDGSSESVHTPYENRTSKDSLTYVVTDTVDNSSDPTIAKIKIEKPNTKITYADMDDDLAHKVAIRLTEEGIFVGECMGRAYFFQPDAVVTRGESMVVVTNATGMEVPEDVECTGFVDDVPIPT